MDSHANLNLIIGDGEGRLTYLRNNAGSQRNTHGTDMIQRLLRNACNLIQILHLSRSCSGNLECINHTCHATALLFGFLRTAGNIIFDTDGSGLHIVHLHHLTGHVKVHIVTAVVAIQAQHAVSTVTGLDHICHLACRRGGKHIADRAAIQHSVTHIAQEHRKMSASARCNDSNFSIRYRIIGNQDPLITI